MGDHDVCKVGEEKAVFLGGLSFGEKIAGQVQAYTDNQPGDMLGLLLYVIAVTVGLLLIWFYDAKALLENENLERTNSQRKRQRRIKNKQKFEMSSLYAALGLEIADDEKFEAFGEHFSSFEEVSSACKRAGLENSNLVIGVDFTASNEWQGRVSFNKNCLHKTSGNKVFNPYQKVIWIIGKTLKPFDADNFIPAYGFGDSLTLDEDVFPFKNDEDLPCYGFEEVLERYNHFAKKVTLSGPTSFAPIISKAIETVKRSCKYHILLIIADGQVTEEGPTIDAIVEASRYPLSIIVVGVGDGPWDIMEEFDHRLPKRKFDNFRFVDYHRATFKAKNPDAVFALQALMEIPDQFKTIKALGYLESIGATNNEIETVRSGLIKDNNIRKENTIFRSSQVEGNKLSHALSNRTGLGNCISSNQQTANKPSSKVNIHLEKEHMGNQSSVKRRLKEQPLGTAV